MGQGPDQAVDFDRLNATERADLALLAQGHTVKSIASLTERSIGAVNERLREARRKTGVGSSRELARLLAAQENRDELIGVADSAVAPASIDPLAAERGRLWKGSIMAVGIGGAVALALFAISAPQMKSSEAVSLIGTTFGSDAADPHALNDRFLKEERDDAWASKTEAALDTRIAPIPNIGPIKVKCASTLCQVAGWIGPGDSSQIDTAMQVLQGPAFRNDAAKLGLEAQAAWFSGDRQRTSFVIFLQRKTG